MYPKDVPRGGGHWYKGPVTGISGPTGSSIILHTGTSLRLQPGRVDPGDPVFINFASRGEQLVAQARLFLVVILLLVHLIPGADPVNRRVTLPLNILALVVAAGLYALAIQRPRSWLGFFSSALDVTMISAGLAAFVVLGAPHNAVNSRVLFDVYLLAIGCASLRYDWRVSAITGLLAVVEYGTIVGYAVFTWDLNDPRFAPFRYGMLDWNVLWARFFLLAGAGVLSAIIAGRAQRLRLLSDTDRLTGVTNRRGFEERMAEEASRARRYSRPLAVALLDIDHFKRVNDDHGHAAGDVVLRTVSETLRGSVRDTDLVARIGGEEFGIIMPETTAEMVMPKLEHIRHAVAQARIDTSRKRTQPVSVTVSIGVANWPDDGAEIDQTLRTADARLYEAKRLGRNRVVGPASA